MIGEEFLVLNWPWTFCAKEQEGAELCYHWAPRSPRTPRRVPATSPCSFCRQTQPLRTRTRSPCPAALLFLQSGERERICTCLLGSTLLPCGRTCTGTHVSSVLRVPNEPRQFSCPLSFNSSPALHLSKALSSEFQKPRTNLPPSSV